MYLPVRYVLRTQWIQKKFVHIVVSPRMNAPTMANPSTGGVLGVESILGGIEMEKELTKVADLMESGENEETEFTCIAVRILGLAANKYTGRLRAKAIKIATAICDFDEELGRKNGH